MSYSLSLLVIAKLVSYSFQGYSIPPGCYYENEEASCDFQIWIPPISESNFGSVQVFELFNINGPIPAMAFSGLRGPDGSDPTTFFQPEMDLNCEDGGHTRFSKDLFTDNLHWVKGLWISNCHIDGGLPSRVFEGFVNLERLFIEEGAIYGAIETESFAGLTNLHMITINTPLPNGELTDDLFLGLEQVKYIDLRFSALWMISVNAFRGLWQLEELDMSSNNLQTLPAGLFDGLTSLQYVQLSYNPWYCSCNLRWLIEWAIHTDAYYELLCKEPDAAEGMDLDDALSLVDCDALPHSTPNHLTTPSQVTNKQEQINMTFAGCQQQSNCFMMYSISGPWDLNGMHQENLACEIFVYRPAELSELTVTLVLNRPTKSILPFSLEMIERHSKGRVYTFINEKQRIDYGIFQFEFHLSYRVDRGIRHSPAGYCVVEIGSYSHFTGTVDRDAALKSTTSVTRSTISTIKSSTSSTGYSTIITKPSKTTRFPIFITRSSNSVTKSSTSAPRLRSITNFSTSRTKYPISTTGSFTSATSSLPTTTNFSTSTFEFWTPSASSSRSTTSFSTSPTKLSASKTIFSTFKAIYLPALTSVSKLLSTSSPSVPSVSTPTTKSLASTAVSSISSTRPSPIFYATAESRTMSKTPTTRHKSSTISLISTNTITSTRSLPTTVTKLNLPETILSSTETILKRSRSTLMSGVSLSSASSTTPTTLMINNVPSVYTPVIISTIPPEIATTTTAILGTMSASEKQSIMHTPLTKRHGNSITMRTVSENKTPTIAHMNPTSMTSLFVRKLISTTDFSSKILSSISSMTTMMSTFLKSDTSTTTNPVEKLKVPISASTSLSSANMPSTSTVTRMSKLTLSMLQVTTPPTATLFPVTSVTVLSTTITTTRKNTCVSIISKATNHAIMSKSSTIPITSTMTTTAVTTPTQPWTQLTISKSPLSVTRTYSNHGVDKEALNMILVSTFSAFAILLIVIACLYRFVCRNKFFGSTNRIDDDQDNGKIRFLKVSPGHTLPQ